MTQVPPFWQGFSAKHTSINTQTEQFCAGLYPGEQVRLQAKQVKGESARFTDNFVRTMLDLEYVIINYHVMENLHVHFHT